MSERGLLTAVAAALVALLVLPAVGFAVEIGLLAAGRPDLVALVEASAGPICHHDPTRTLALLPVCARCTGLYAGAATGGLAGLAVGGASRAGLRAFAGGLAIAFVGALGLAIAESAGVIGTSNVARLVLGVPLGAAPVTVAGLGARILWKARP